MNNNYQQRLQKVIANAGVCSRRKAEILITTGQVSVNNLVITTLGFKVNCEDIIKVNDKIIKNQQLYYLAFYKPQNCLSTVSDLQQRPTIMTYFSKINSRIYPVGRLDFNTTGLLLMTNDGNFTNAIIHPRYKINKVYEVVCQGIIKEKQIQQLTNGIKLNDNFTTAPAIVKIIAISKYPKTTIIHLTIHEGHHHQVKKMINAIGSQVLQLKRLQIGNITLKNLKTGQYRSLTNQEITNLMKLSQNPKN